MSLPWNIWIDTGGTFTDCIAISPDGRMKRIKVLSSSCLRGRILKKTAPCLFQFEANWDVKEAIFQGYDFKVSGNPAIHSQIRKMDFKTNLLTLDKDIPLTNPTDFEITTNEEVPVLAARLATATPLHASFPPIQMRLGTTKGTNALLESKGARIAFLTTKGFGDLLEIGNQQRPDLFQLDIPAPKLLYREVIEVEERLNARGEVIQTLAQEEISRIVKRLKRGGFTVVAITLLHAYKNPVHEKLLENTLKKAGISFISCSHTLSPTIKILPRAQTALVDAFLAPIMQTYLANVRTGQDDLQLKVMTSAGGLADANHFHPKDSLLSGPAGGVVGAATVAEELGLARVLTLDMGGTSTDTARYDGRHDYRYETHVGDFKMTSPCLSIETVAAGGGSICHFDGFKLCVGPESAGANPGPACYGAGGPLTITDVNLLLGKLQPSEFGIPIDEEKAEQTLKDLQKQIRDKTGHLYEAEELLRGFEQIADEKMAEAIHRISVAQGFDPTEYALLVFGGAGGLHGCRIAELLDISTLILPYDGGLLSAYGMGHAQLERFVERQVLKPLSQTHDNWKSLLDELKEESVRKLEKEGIERKDIILKNVLAYLRFSGQESTVEIPWNAHANLTTDFEKKYRKLFGHWPLNKAVELESVKVIAATKKRPAGDSGSLQTDRPKTEQIARSADSQESPVPVYKWNELEPDQHVCGPAIILGKHATAFIERGWEGQVKSNKNIVARLSAVTGKNNRPQKEAIELELFTNRFKAIAQEMGAQLQRTAFSVNVKERLDFSCAILDANAELLVNAPHIPVHLGSLGICARLILADFELKKGDVIITNHPKYGGSHLPDITLLSGVFLNNDELIGYVINRAHHAEIGGKRPGSMPPDAVTLAEEGVVFLPTYLVKKGEAQWHLVEDLLTQAPYPTRALNENLADINAALAALRTGEETLKRLVKNYGLETVHFYMSKLKETAKIALKEALAPFYNQTFRATEFLDDGHRINVSVDLQPGKTIIDFNGTSPVHPYNLNANKSIVYSVIIYFLRLLCKKAIPLNEGLMEEVSINLPTCFLNPDFQDDPAHCPAVVGGNTEVSQRLVDTLLKALGVAACSQGTMNNFLFGNDNFGYYETIGGGCGAGPGFHGRSAVHQHMTNTRITDPEELEFRYPVILRRFAVRKGSGGQGRWNGGDGIIREFEFLENVEITLISQHRKEQPYGLDGGTPGLAGRQWIVRANGKIENLEGVDGTRLFVGDRIVVETPGGGAVGVTG